MSKIFPVFVHDVATGIEITSPSSYGAEPRPLKMANGTASTMWDIFNYYCREYKDRNFLGVRPYDMGKEDQSKKGRAIKKANDITAPYAWVTYEKCAEVVETVSSALNHIGVKKGDVIAICGPNSPEYIMVFWAIIRTGCVPAPLQMGTSALEFSLILRQAPIKAIFLTGQMFPWLIQTMNSLARDDLAPTIRSVVFLPRQPGLPDYIDAAQAEENSKEFRWRVFSFQNFLKLGKKTTRTASSASAEGSAPSAGAPAIGADDPFAILFSSGTVGAPRGVCITHKSAVNATALVAGIPQLKSVVAAQKPKDLKYVVSVNLAFVSELLTFFSLMRHGFAFAFATGEFSSPEGLFIDYKEIEPLIINTTPQMWRLIEQAIGGHFCFNPETYKSGGPSGGQTTAAKFRKMVGGNLKFVMTSGAPISVESALWIKKTLGIDISQAYGLTETCGIATYNINASESCVDGPFGKIVSCGYPFPGVTIQLRDCPEAGIVVKGQKEIRGEIYIRTSTKFGGYLDDEDLTEYVYGTDGFIRTGDIGQLNPDGSITVIDRCFPGMKVQCGSLVPFSVLETILGMTPLANNVVIYTSPLEMVSIAIVSASIDGLDDCAMLPSTAREPCAKARANPKSSAPRKLLELPEIQDLYLREFNRIEEENAMPPFYRIQAVILDSREWTEENGFTTETGKVRRGAVLEKFKERIDAVMKDLLTKQPELLVTHPSRAENESSSRAFLFLTDKVQLADLDKPN